MAMVATNPLNVEAPRTLLCDLFNLPSVTKIEMVYDRYRCFNYKVDTPDNTYFLKQYCGRLSEEVLETKLAECYFADHEVPIVLPIQERFGRPVFQFQEDWFSLFTFIDARQPKPNKLSDAFLRSLGTQLAKLHRVGSMVRLDSFRRLQLWEAEQFMFEMVDLETMLEQEREHPGAPSFVLETMEKKLDL